MGHVYLNDDIDRRYQRAKKLEKLPIFTDKEYHKTKGTFKEELAKNVYILKAKFGMSWGKISKLYNITVPSAKELYNLHKKMNYIGYRKEPTVYVPAWNDIIHLVDEKQLSPEEQKKRMKKRIRTLEKSPSPYIAHQITTILTAIDDVQDFCTAIGVTARLLEKATKLPHIVSEGAFTSGELLNSLNLHNKIPYEKLGIGRLRDLIRRKKVNLDLLTPDQLKSLAKDLKTIHPDWEKFPIAKQQEFMRKHYKMTRERWGTPLKVKKRQAENLYAKGTPFGKLRTKVDAKLKRTLPTHGEMIEIGQTSDTLAGVGISLGPLIGFIMDSIFGAIHNRPFKWTPQKISPEELKALKDIGYYLLNLPMETFRSLETIGNIMVKTTMMIAAGEDLGINDFLTATWANAQAYLGMRGKELNHAISYTTEKIKGWVFGTGKKTSPFLKATLIEQGINPDREEGFPGVKLGPLATIDEISCAYLEKSQQVIKHFQKQLSKDVYGEFMASCLSAISFKTCCVCQAPDEVTYETFTPELAIYTRACDYGLVPPITSTNEEFARWHSILMDQCRIYDLEAPTYKMYLEAFSKVFH